jgi:hypothetical protein
MLIVKSAASILPCMDDKELFRKLGALFLAERVQVKDWNESEAAFHAKVAPKTIRRIERGQNYEWESVGKYAAALGRPLSSWLADVIHQETSRDHASTAGGLQRTGTDKRAVNLGPPSGIPDRRRHG